MAFVEQTTFNQFRDYVNAELPRRALMLRPVFVGGYDGNPNLSANATLNNAPAATWYQESAGSLWQKVVPAGPTDWVQRFAGTTGSRFGWVRVVDILPQAGGTISGKTFQDPGADTILQTFTTDDLDVRVSIEACYPKVEVNGTPATLPKVGDVYAGIVDITLSGAGDVVVQLITADDELGGADTSVAAFVAPPTITLLRFTGGYPGSQTEVKENDTYDILVEADKNFDQVIIEDYEAGQSATIGVASTNSTTVSVTIADRGDSAVLRPARVSVRDAITGSISATRDTNQGGGSTDGLDVVLCNNLYPSVSFGSVTYPVSQSALKASETADVANTVSDFDTITYDDLGTAHVSIPSTTTFQNPKTVTRIGGTYNVSGDGGVNNIRITANRAANDATTAVSSTVNIASVAAQISISEPFTRLRSGGDNGTSIQSYTITSTSNQQLQGVVDIDIQHTPVSGGWTAGWSGGPKSFTRQLQVHDDDPKGTFTWQPAATVGTNLAGIVTSAITGDNQYVLGGFVARTLTYSVPFSTSVSMDVEVVDFTKLTAGIFTATNQPALKQAIGTPPSVTNGFTIDAVSINPTAVIWLDSPAAGSNSSGTAQITDVEETV